jgi:hypothetical protein
MGEPLLFYRKANRTAFVVRCKKEGRGLGLAKTSPLFFMAYNVRAFAMFGAGTILARSATPAPNMGERLQAANRKRAVM